MAYQRGHPKREKAFDLFLAGASYQEIAQEIGVSKNTIVKWAKDDEWKDRKQKILEKSSEKADELRATEIIEKLKSSLVDMEHQLKKAMNIAEPRSLEGIVRARLEIYKMLKETFSDPDKSIDEVVNAVIDVFLEHPKIGPIVMKYKDDIVNKIMGKLS